MSKFVQKMLILAGNRSQNCRFRTAFSSKATLMTEKAGWKTVRKLAVILKSAGFQEKGSP